jgi:hypothetical protein
MVYNKELPPPYQIDCNGEMDVSNFHEGMITASLCVVNWLGFTLQAVSLSLVDDTVSCTSTPPDGRSRFFRPLVTPHTEQTRFRG